MYIKNKHPSASLDQTSMTLRYFKNPWKKTKLKLYKMF